MRLMGEKEKVGYVEKKKSEKEKENGFQREIREETRKTENTGKEK